MKKISIIIPNYNNERFITKCLYSVINQDYPNIEIIVVDDGSTDKSVDIIRKFIDAHQKNKILLVCQNNLNASIARNNGMSIATGDYVLFLDSDDILECDVLSKMTKKKEKNDVDLLIGGYYLINANDKRIGEKSFVKKEKVADVMGEFGDLVHINPVPSNKLFDLRVIKENNLQWGNVRIGQDLNFYLKYLSLCKRVLLTEEYIYSYRINGKSMSRTFDWRILDIVNAFGDIKDFYFKNGNDVLFRSYIPLLALKHFEYQMSKQKYYKSHEARDLIVRYFAVNEKELDYSLCDKSSNEYIETIRRFRLKCFLRRLFTSSIYSNYKIKREERLNDE